MTVVSHLAFPTRRRFERARPWRLILLDSASVRPGDEYGKLPVRRQILPRCDIDESASMRAGPAGCVVCLCRRLYIVRQKRNAVSDRACSQ